MALDFGGEGRVCEHVGELKFPAGGQHPVQLLQHLVLVHGEVHHAVGDDQVHRVLLRRSEAAAAADDDDDDDDDDNDVLACSRADAPE